MEVYDSHKADLSQTHSFTGRVKSVIRQAGYPAPNHEANLNSKLPIYKDIKLQNPSKAGKGDRFSTHNSIDSNWLDLSTCNSFSTDAKCQRNSSLRPSQALQQLSSCESPKVRKRHCSYLDKLKAATPKNRLNKEFIEPQDSLPLKHSVKHRRHSSLGGSDNEMQVLAKCTTTPATPKLSQSPRNHTEVLAVLRRKYKDCEIEAMQMPVECPKVVLVCRGSRVQAFAVKLSC
jgi:hypothetical protein